MEFDIRRKHEVVAQVWRRAVHAAPFYEIIANSEHLKVKGDSSGWNYSIVRHGATIATLAVTLGLVDVYDVDIADGEDPVTLLAIAIVIDKADHG